MDYGSGESPMDERVMKPPYYMEVSWPGLYSTLLTYSTLNRKENKSTFAFAPLFFLPESGIIGVLSSSFAYIRTSPAIFECSDSLSIIEFNPLMLKRKVK